MFTIQMLVDALRHKKASPGCVSIFMSAAYWWVVSISRRRAVEWRIQLHSQQLDLQRILHSEDCVYIGSGASVREPED